MNKIKHFRKENNLTQKELAKMLEQSQSTISRWETNKRSPSLDKAIELSQTLKADFLELYGYNNESKEAKEFAKCTN